MPYDRAPPERPSRGSAIEDYVVEDHTDHVLATFKPHVARVRHLNDKKG